MLVIYSDVAMEQDCQTAVFGKWNLDYSNVRIT
jgi:hypothetical protein